MTPLSLSVLLSTVLFRSKVTVVGVLEITEPLDIVPAKFLTVKLTGSFSVVVITSETPCFSRIGSAPIIWELADVLQPSMYDNKWFILSLHLVVILSLSDKYIINRVCQYSQCDIVLEPCLYMSIG